MASVQITRALRYFFGADPGLYILPTIASASRSVCAALSAVISRWADASISYPTMNFLTVAERNNGG